MAYLWGPRRALSLAAVLATTASAAYIRPNTLFERADSTCAVNFTRCSSSGLPDNFCCEPNTTCIALAGNTTVLCCPEGKTCNKISPITCDLALQDPVENPEAEIKTTVLDGVLETCGTGTCCPFGYHCDGTTCVKNTDQSKKPDSKPSSASPSAPAPTSTNPSTSKTTTVAVSEITSTTQPPASPTETDVEPTSVPTNEPTSEPVTETPPTSNSTTAETVKIVGGVIGGVAGFVLVILAVIFARYKRKQQLQRREQLQRHESTSSFGNIISAPVPHAKYPNERLDFLAKQSQSSSPRSFTPSSPTAVASPNSHRKPDEGYGGFGFMPPNSPYSPYARRPDSEMSDAPRSYHASAEIGGLRSLTGWNQFQQSSGEGSGSNGMDNFSTGPTPTVTVTPARDGTIKGRDKGKGKERAQFNEDEGMSINVFADPRKVASGRPDSSVTTWSRIQQRADTNSNNGNAPPTRGQARLGDQLPRWR
ncbi:uncharacterized protein F4812DRAFT_346583 [Daldinia caldariorum]|uniref:uncharacterized protein n=1 Tax=Daldinia caldariorum TaxID=326644 RepID=UPI00200830DA|nr:uncharacterized protein F4812DRAFT_346583 [Daldinia caldariorum]KAI1468778.1 hypothetical protein F4812DRAFT_346583 [Daldinia caldariorum]